MVAAPPTVDLDAVISLGIDRLTGKVPEDSFLARTHILLVGDEGDVPARFVMELVPGPKGRLLPDPLLNSITRIDREIVEQQALRFNGKRLAQLVAEDVWWYDAYKDARYTPEMAALAVEGCAPGPILNHGWTVTIAGCPSRPAD